MKNSVQFACFLFAFIALTSCAEVVDGSKTSHSVQKSKNANVFSAFAQSFSSIVVSELGDKTFFIAAIMAMRYNRIAVLCGSLAALFLMTAISTAFGTIVPTFLPQSVTHILITILFFFFGGKLLYDAYTDDGEGGDEQAEVEIELNQMHAKLMKSAGNSRQEIQIEDISNEADPLEITENKTENQRRSSVNCATKIEEVASKLVFWQALTMTFLGEWGDRSQISTIALAAESSALFVFIGAFLGHVLCTTLAVIGGKFLAKKISERTVNICGGILFLMFGLHNLFLR
jgi:putative Ca2+/H+ antiporter (TMEM165/GDT1 family)